MRFDPWRRFHKREESLDEEIQCHLDMAARNRIERGAAPEKADADARREFGNVGLVKETTRAAWGWVWLEQLGQDLRYALRMLRRSPGFTTVAVLSLGLGIGANTAIFTIIDALVLRTLPVRNPRELVTPIQYQPGGAHPWFPYQWFERYRNTTQVFIYASAVHEVDRSNVTVNGGTSEEQVRVALVTGNHFLNLGINAVIGRLLTPEDDRELGGHPVAVISYDYWKRRFSLSAEVLGRTFTLNGTTYNIIGVAPRLFSGEWLGSPTDIWIPVAMLAQVRSELPPGQSRGNPVLYRIVGRLRPGATIEQAQAAAQVLYQQLLTEQAGASPTPEDVNWIAQSHIELEPAATGFSPQRKSLAQPLEILMIMVGLVLLIACANVASLLLARSAARQREMAVRLAIGAGRMRIGRQLLTESVLLATMGGALGFLFGRWGTYFLAGFAGSGIVTRDDRRLALDLHLNARILGFTAGLCLVTGVLFGLAPALRSCRVSLRHVMATRGPDSDWVGTRFGLGKLLVTGQVALSLVLLIGAGLFVRSVRNLQSQDLGVDREHLLLAWVGIMQSGKRVGAPMAPLFQTVQQRVSSLPGVVSASPSVYGFLNGNPFMGSEVQVQVQGYVPAPGEDSRATGDLVAPGFVETMGMRLLAGRDFTEGDKTTSPKVAIINENMARRVFGGQNPIGQHFGRGSGAPTTELEIVGVINNATDRTPYDRTRMMYYRPYSQDLGHLLSMCLAVRTAGSPKSVAASVRQELRDIDPSLPVLRIDTVDEQLNDSLVEERLVASLASFFGGLAVLLACLGLYGVVSYAVVRRTSEIGIRLALGATRGRVLAMVLKQSLLLVAIGIAGGVPMTLAGARLISNRLFGVGPADPLTIAAAALLLIAVAAVAGFLPARRASRVDPMVSLRYE
jgi:predicted permease